MNATPYPACELAAYLLGKVRHPAGETINTLKLNALLYYAEAWSLAMFEREITPDELQAWDSGPMYPALWNLLGHRGWNDLAADDLAPPPEFDEETQGLLDDVWQAYGDFSLPELEKMIKADAPWKEARRGLQAWDITKRPMSKPRMAEFYQATLDAPGQPGLATQRPERNAILGPSF